MTINNQMLENGRDGLLFSQAPVFDFCKEFEGIQ
jgi:hypothetical protein